MTELSHWNSSLRGIDNPCCPEIADQFDDHVNPADQRYEDDDATHLHHEDRLQYPSPLSTRSDTLSETQARGLDSTYSDGVACVQAYWAYSMEVFYYRIHLTMDRFTQQPFVVYAYRINNSNLSQVSSHTYEDTTLEWPGLNNETG